MAGKLNPFQMVGFSHWKGLTRNNHLGSIFQLAPQKASDLMVRLLGFQRGKTYGSYINSLPVKEFDTDAEYTWDAVASSSRNIPLKEVRKADGSAVAAGDIVGANGERFELVFGEDWFALGEVIIGAKNLYPARIVADPKMEGTDAVYCCEWMGGYNVDGVKADAITLAAGERYSVEYAPVERELSRKQGDIRFSTPISMRNEFSRIRIQHKVPGSMLDQKLAVGIPITESNGATTVKNMWMHVVEYELECQWDEYKNNILMFGRSNRNANGEYLNMGLSGNVLQMGAGIREQLEAGNTRYFDETKPVLNKIMDSVIGMYASKLDFGQRRFIIKTGEYGAMKLSQEIAQEGSGWALLVAGSQNPATIQKVSSNLHSNALSAGAQFTEFRAPNGYIFSVEVDPMYDNPVRNKILSPLGGVAESYRMDVIYAGDGNDQNVFRCAVRNQPELRGYQWGLRDPFTGRMNNQFMSFDEDSAVVHRMATLGALVLDPTKAISFIPTGLA